MRPKLLFVTDPLCSWCWGTLPELDSVKETLKREVDFDLIMAGLQIGTPDGLLDYDIKRLNRLWSEVANITGQSFSHIVPEGFVYHSEIACRAVEIARRKLGVPPFEFLHQLQSAFYEDGKNIQDVNVLAGLLELSKLEIVQQLQAEDIIVATRANFELAKSLSANALPNFLMDTGAGYRLLCGGYVTAEFLIPDIRTRISG